jgi:hypothetical protein
MQGGAADGDGSLSFLSIDSSNFRYFHNFQPSTPYVPSLCLKI